MSKNAEENHCRSESSSALAEAVWNHILSFMTKGLFPPFLSTNSSKAVNGQQVEYHHAGPFSPRGKANNR